MCLSVCVSVSVSLCVCVSLCLCVWLSGCLVVFFFGGGGRGAHVNWTKSCICARVTDEANRWEKTQDWARNKGVSSGQQLVALTN